VRPQPNRRGSLFCKVGITNIRLASTQWSALIRIGPVTRAPRPRSSIASLPFEVAGFQVLDASNGADALVLSVLLLQEHHIDILVTDVVMKNMDGFTLAHALEERRPGVLVLFLSG